MILKTLNPQHSSDHPFVGFVYAGGIAKVALALGTFFSQQVTFKSFITPDSAIAGCPESLFGT